MKRVVEDKSLTLGIAIVIEPVVVPVPRAIILAIEIERVAIAVRIEKDCIRHRLFHHPLKSQDDLKVESNLAS